MRVRVLFFASLRERAGRTSEELELEPGATVGELWRSLSARPEFSAGMSRPGFAVNGRWCGSTQPLREGDEVGILPPVSGG